MKLQGFPITVTIDILDLIMIIISIITIVMIITMRIISTNTINLTQGCTINGVKYSMKNSLFEVKAEWLHKCSWHHCWGVQWKNQCYPCWCSYDGTTDGDHDSTMTQKSWYQSCTFNVVRTPSNYRPAPSEWGPGAQYVHRFVILNFNHVAMTSCSWIVWILWWK